MHPESKKWKSTFAPAITAITSATPVAEIENAIREFSPLCRQNNVYLTNVGAEWKDGELELEFSVQRVIRLTPQYDPLLVVPLSLLPHDSFVLRDYTHVTLASKFEASYKYSFTMDPLLHVKPAFRSSGMWEQSGQGTEPVHEYTENFAYTKQVKKAARHGEAAKVKELKRALAGLKLHAPVREKISFLRNLETMRAVNWEEKTLYCPVCQSFKKNDYFAVMDCFHVTCDSCLKHMVAATMRIDCPFCKTPKKIIRDSTAEPDSPKDSSVEDEDGDERMALVEEEKELLPAKKVDFNVNDLRGGSREDLLGIIA
jgi:hypothetical protein